MKKRLVLLTVLTNVLVLLLLGLAVAPLTQPEVSRRLEEAMKGDLVAFGTFVLQPVPPTADQARAFVTELDTSPDYRLGATSRRDQIVMGSAGDSMLWLMRLPSEPRSTDRPRQLAPRCFISEGDHVCSLGITDVQSYFWAINGIIPAAVISQQVQRHWLRLGAIGAAAILVSLIGAVLVSSRITKPITRIKELAEEMGAGNLDARPATTGPAEIVSLGESLSRLATRIDRLLTAERERSAELSHRLRTPLTVLRLEIGRLKPMLEQHPEQDARLARAVLNLEQGLDDLIRDSQMTRDETGPEPVDLVAVLDEHLRSWEEAAQAQGRAISREAPETPLYVRMSSKDLGSVLDSLIGNVFRHTPASGGLGIAVATQSKEGRRYVNLVVSDSGTDGGGLVTSGETGSTGLGLDFARRLVQEAGGLFDAKPDPSAGYRVRIQLDLVSS